MEMAAWMRATTDERVFLHRVRWSDYQTLLRLRGDSPVPRIQYLAGEVELMTPAVGHEVTSRVISRLVEAWADKRDVHLNSVGSWTVKARRSSRGVEPDGCYTVGRAPREGGRPDLAIEVTWSHGGLDKLEIYRRLGVKEVWYWERGQIHVYRLRHGRYERGATSVALRGIDLTALARFATWADQTAAVRAFRRTVRRA